jgi:hypothetical protein
MTGSRAGWTEGANHLSSSLGGLLRRHAPAINVCSECRDGCHSRCSGKMRRKYERGTFACECMVCAKRKQAKEPL